MSTRTATRPIEVPNVVGYNADEAIQELRQLGLIPLALSAAVEDVSEAGFVLGIEPPPGGKVRSKALISLSVATHPDFKGHVEAGLDARTDTPIQPPLAWPHSGPTGLEPAPETQPEPVAEAFPTAAAPDAASAPASLPLDAASRELRSDAARSSVQPMASGAAATSDLLDLSAPVPTPDELGADAEWDRLRAAEAPRHANQPRPSGAQAAPDSTSAATVMAAEPGHLKPDRELEEQARRLARRRSSRRYRRLTGKQKLVVVTVVTLTGLLALAAASNHKPPGHLITAARGPDARRRAGRAPVPAAHAPRQPSSAPPRRVVVIRTRTVTVTTPVPVAHRNTAPPASHTGSASSSAAPTSPPAARAPASTGYQASPTPFSKPASNPTSADSRSSGTGSGSTLQSPDGATAPPQP